MTGPATELSGSALPLPLPVLEEAMREAVVTAGEQRTGFGALLLDPACAAVVHSAANTRLVEGSPLAHAEMNLLHEALRRRSELSGLVLVSTAEPCPMCACAALLGKVGAIVYGTSITTLAARGWWQVNVRCRDIVACSPRAGTPVLGGVLEQETDRLLATARPLPRVPGDV